IVVAALAAAEFVARRELDGALGREQGSKQGADIGLAPGADGRIAAGAFDAAVPGAVLILAVAVVLAIGLIVLAVIGDEIGDGETVLGGDEIRRPRTGAREHIRRAGDPCRQ